MESDINDWILNRLSTPLDNFNNLPACPFAKKALIDNKIKMLEIHHKDDFLKLMNEFTIQWPNNIDVLILGCDPSIVPAIELSTIVEDANNGFLKERNYIALEDHPADPEYAAGYYVNEGNWALILLQLKDKINFSRKILEKQGYYKNWSDTYYKEVVLDRS